MSSQTGGGSSPTAARPSAAELELAGRGLIAETYPEDCAIGTSVLTSGTLVWHAVGLRAGVIVTGVAPRVQANGSSLTLGQVMLARALADTTTLTVLAVSADVNAGFSAGTVPRYQQCPLTAPYPIPDDHCYYVGLLIIGTTPPTCYRVGASGTASLIGTFPPKYGGTAGQAGLLAVNDTKVIAPGQGFGIHMGVY